MCRARIWGISIRWTLCLLLGLAAVGYLRCVGDPWEVARDRRGPPVPRGDGAHLAMPLRFVCVGSRAFDLGEGRGRSPEEEGGPVVRGAGAARRCRPPGLTLDDATRWLLAATAPGVGYGAALVDVDGGAQRAMAAIGGRLVEGGWTAGADSGDGGPVSRSYRREGGWLLVAAVDGDDASTRVLFVEHYLAAKWR